jgi:hypothetical protein
MIALEWFSVGRNDQARRAPGTTTDCRGWAGRPVPRTGLWAAGGKPTPAHPVPDHRPKRTGYQSEWEGRCRPALQMGKKVKIRKPSKRADFRQSRQMARGVYLLSRPHASQRGGQALLPVAPPAPSFWAEPQSRRKPVSPRGPPGFRSLFPGESRGPVLGPRWVPAFAGKQRKGGTQDKLWGSRKPGPSPATELDPGFRRNTRMRLEIGRAKIRRGRPVCLRATARARPPRTSPS